MDIYFENVRMPDAGFRVRCTMNTNLERDMQVHPHWHPEVEVLYYISGSARQQVNHRIFTAQKGDVVVIGKDQIHSTYSDRGDPCEIMVLLFEADGVLNLPSAAQGAVGARIYDEHAVISNPIQPGGDFSTEIALCIREAAGELEARRDSYKWLVISALCRLTGLLSRGGYYEGRSDASTDMEEAKQVLKKTFKLIDEGYSHEITLNMAAAASNLSKTHFCRLFKRAAGMTFMDYLAFYRVNRAERLLHSSRSVTEVAYECGFGSLSSFIRNFKRFKNCTPSAYKSTRG